MKILVIGGGGREHALVWKLAQSPLAQKIYAIPGNPGISKFAESIPIKVDNIPAILDFALKEEIDLTVVGPELPLSLGICDRFREANLKIFGPSGDAARIESSKAFSKKLMVKYHIPTASSETFSSPHAAKEYIKKSKKPLVIKADGLAAGKGVVIVQSDQDGLDTIDLFMNQNSLGEAGKSVLIEEFLEGEEVSFIVISDGKSVVPLVPAQDHKKIFDGERGPNTGGMGTYSPVPSVSKELEESILNQIMVPIIRAMEKEGSPFLGFLFGGLMLTTRGIKVLEFNARLGDPETQVILTRLDSDLLQVLTKAVDGKLDDVHLKWKNLSSVCVVVASEGYPARSSGKVPITGLDKVDPERDHCIILQAGTERTGDTVMASGGRVLGVTAWGESIAQAREFAYQAIEKIQFKGMQFRKDIGLKAMRR